MGARGAGEAATLVPEQLALDQLGRHGGAVERDERLLSPAAELVQCLRDELLSRAALPLHQHGRVGGRDPCDHVVDRLHGWRGPDQGSEVAEAAERAAQRFDLLPELTPADDVRQHRFETRDVDRLGQVVRGTAAERLDRGIDGGVAGDQDDLGGDTAVDLSQELETAAVGQLQVDQRQVGGVLAQEGARFPQARGSVHREPLRPHQLGQGRLEAGVVIDEEGFRHGRT